MKPDFKSRLNLLTSERQKLLKRENGKVDLGNGIFHRYKFPVLQVQREADKGCVLSARMCTELIERTNQ